MYLKRLVRECNLEVETGFNLSSLLATLMMDLYGNFVFKELSFSSPISHYHGDNTEKRSPFVFDTK